jgi:LmbE family N-acetylglucosaminyl deacetylase
MTTARRASLLMVVAHPDDEIFHGGALAQLSRVAPKCTFSV